MKTFDAVIVGGGVIGAAIAFELAGEKLRVLVIDRQAPGREASWAAAGMLSPGPDSPEAVPLVPLGQESLRLYPEFVAGIEEASGRVVDFAREGTFEVFAGPDGETARDKMIEEYRDLGLAIEAISVEAARGLEPELGSAASAAAWLPEEATVDPRLLTEAVLAAAERRGAVIREACAVKSLWCEGGACKGVIAAGGEKIEGEHVVIAAGTFCGTIKDYVSGADGNLARYAPVRPVRGQLVALRSATVKLKKVLRSSRGYLVPRRDGRIIAGSTLENAGFVKQVTPEGIRKILEAAAELAPALARAEIVEQWAGLRPDSPDHLPIIGPTEMKGLLIATGHYRNGILLAPVTAKIVRDWIVSGKASFMAEGFSPLRFTAAKSRARTGA
ncbi:MAG: glycine oxidase ThiO [Candidatus Acidiferrales bacterium]